MKKMHNSTIYNPTHYIKIKPWYRLLFISIHNLIWESKNNLYTLYKCQKIVQSNLLTISDINNDNFQFENQLSPMGLE